MFRRGRRALRHSNSGRSFTFWALVALLILLFISVMLVFGTRGRKTDPLPTILEPDWGTFNPIIRLDPTVQLRKGREVISQVPGSPKAVLFLAHGCNGRAGNFWDKSPTCEKCVGLPEERLLVLHALARNFAIVAISSAGRCWTFGEELLVVRDTIEWWRAKEKLNELPLLALGASSGGYFVSVLATRVKFSAITIMIAEGMFGKMDIKSTYPPTLFVHMPKDEARKQRIDKYLVVLREKGINVEEIKCMEFPLTPNHFADVIAGIDKNLSAQLFYLFKEKGFIDKDGYMMNDGRAIQWKASLKDKGITLPDESLFNHIQEEMNLAYAYHEMTSLPSEQIMDWFESHLS
ncbi:OLC1v1023579C3 [Oldenlandia corymbosa var. corymbosa]|nr:OLC1v1023579C3 [Oldenlandia corymbosa var. corymbosa]